MGLMKKKVEVLVVGLDNSGKTTILTHLKASKDEVTEVVPTVGFTVETFNKESLAFTAFDMSGQGKYRNLWSQYYATCDGIIWVIDAADKLRLEVVKDELEELREDPTLSARLRAREHIPVLFF